MPSNAGVGRFHRRCSVSKSAQARDGPSVATVPTNESRGRLVRVLRRVAFWVALTLVLAPVAVVLTVLLQPAWDWFESATGIESLGHSGPAEWCYLVMYVALLGLAAALRRATGAREARARRRVN